MSTWLHERPTSLPRTPLQRLRASTAGARLTWAGVAALAVALVVSLVSFVVHVQARSALRAALEDAAVQALPADLPVELRGVYAAGSATGYATAFSPLPPDRALRGHQPRGGSRWQPIPGADTADQRAWLSASRRYVMTIDVLSCEDDDAPGGCPAGGSALTVEVLQAGPASRSGPGVQLGPD